MARPLLILVAVGACAGCQSSVAPTAVSSLPTASSPASRQFESRLATPAEIDRAIAIVRANEALRGRQHHIDTVACRPLTVSDWIVNDSLLLRWSTPWDGSVFGSTICVMFGEETRYEYTVNLVTAEVEMSPDYWLQDVAPYNIQIGAASFTSFVLPIVPRNDIGPDTPGNWETPPPLLHLHPALRAQAKVDAVDRAITIVRAKETLDGDERRIEIVLTPPFRAWSVAPDEVLVIWHEKTDHYDGISSGALNHSSNEHIYGVTLSTGQVERRIDWFSYPRVPW